MSLRRIGLIANDSKAGAKELATEIARAFERSGMSPLLDSRTAELIGADSASTPGALARECDLLVVLGGDGTILQVLHELEQRTPPMFGINLGSLGFLTSASAGQWAAAVDAIMTNNYVPRAAARTRRDPSRGTIPAAQIHPARDAHPPGGRDE